MSRRLIDFTVLAWKGDTSHGALLRSKNTGCYQAHDMLDGHTLHKIFWVYGARRSQVSSPRKYGYTSLPTRGFHIRIRKTDVRSMMASEFIVNRPRISMKYASVLSLRRKICMDFSSGTY